MENRLKHVPLAFFALFCLKFLILNGSTPVDAALLLVSGALCAFYEIKLDNKKLKELEDKIKRQEELLAIQQTRIDDVKNYIAGTKLSASFRPTGSQR